MAKFELLVNELVNHQHRVVVEAENEDEVISALKHADSFREDRADDYVHRIKEKLEVIEHDDDYSVESKEVECDDFIEIPIEEVESEDEI